MEITTNVNGTDLVVSAKGKLDSIGAPEFSQIVEPCAEGMTSVTLDFEEVSYVSSAGLRAVLKLKMCAKGADVCIINAKGMTKELFRTAGFGSLLRRSPGIGPKPFPIPHFYIQGT